MVQKVSDIDGILLNNLKRKKLKDNCTSFFKQKLDFNLYAKELLWIIAQTASGKNFIEKKQNELYMDADFKPDSHILKLQEIYLQYQELDLKYQKILGTISFRILSLLFNPLDVIKKLWYRKFS